ncbi:hypothetical protein INR49_014431, partial [Caranx melampygus]
MTEEISGGAYKLVIYLSQTSLLFGRLPVVCAAADKDISGGRSRGRNALIEMTCATPPTPAQPPSHPAPHIQSLTLYLFEECKEIFFSSSSESQTQQEV